MNGWRGESEKKDRVCSELELLDTFPTYVEFYVL